MAPTSFRSFTARLNSAAAGIGARHRQRGEAGEPLGFLADDAGEVVVDLARQVDAGLAGHQVGTGAAVGEHLRRDAGVVHRLEALLADLRQQLHRVLAPAAIRRPPLKPRRAMAALSIFAATDGTVKCSSSVTTRMDGFLPILRKGCRIHCRHWASAACPGRGATRSDAPLSRGRCAFRLPDIGSSELRITPSATRPCSSCRSTRASSGSRRPRGAGARRTPP